MKVGLLHSLIRKEEKLLIEEFRTRGVDLVMIDDRKLISDLESAPSVDILLERSINHSRSMYGLRLLEAAGVPCGPVYNYADMFADPQVQHRGMVVSAHDDELGEVQHIRSPIKMTGEKSGGGGVAVRTVAPKLGAHNEEIYGSVGVNAEQLAELKAKGVI